MTHVLGGEKMSILQSVRTMVLGNTDDTEFDTDLIIHINSVFSVLYQLGVGPDNGFKITGASETWEQYLSNETALDLVKTYMFLKIRLIFDPPTGSVLNSYDAQVKELEWRLNVFSHSELSTETGD